jgi:hypothetical protein
MTDLSTLSAQWSYFPLFPILSADPPRCSCSEPNCADVGKHPAYPWKSLRTAEKKRGEGKLEGCGYGIATGERSGFFVVDIDIAKHPNALADW